MSIIVLPLPPDTLRVNHRLGRHWGPLHRDKADYRTACLLLLKGQVWLVDGYPVHLEATLYLGKGQRCDPTDAGSWCKVCVDCLVTAGLLAGDSAAHINPFTARVERDWKNPRVEFRLC